MSRRAGNLRRVSFAEVAVPQVREDQVSFSIPAALLGDDVDAVFLEVDWTCPDPVAFDLQDQHWTLTLPRPLAHRFEYKLAVRDSAGEYTHPIDPTNPRTVPGPFGDKSEILFPDYQPPAWLTADDAGSVTEIIDPGGLEVAVPATLFTPAALGPHDQAPLVIAHDGTDLASRGSLRAWAAAQPAPPRLLLLDPPLGYRNPWYAANPDYVDHLERAILPQVRELTPITHTIGLGCSLGAVAMLTWHRRHPGALDALALLSGSFFTPKLDSMESTWPQFNQVCAAVQEFTSALPGQVRPVPTFIAVGAVEENRANNERMAGALQFQEYPVEAKIFPDAHNMIGWRDVLSPGLDALLTRGS